MSIAEVRTLHIPSPSRIRNIVLNRRLHQVNPTLYPYPVRSPVRRTGPQPLPTASLSSSSRFSWITFLTWRSTKHSQLTSADQCDDPEQ